MRTRSEITSSFVRSASGLADAPEVVRLLIAIRDRGAPLDDELLSMITAALFTAWEAGAATVTDGFAADLAEVRGEGGTRRGDTSI